MCKETETPEQELERYKAFLSLLDQKLSICQAQADRLGSTLVGTQAAAKSISVDIASIRKEIEHIKRGE